MVVKTAEAPGAIPVGKGRAAVEIVGEGHSQVMRCGRQQGGEIDSLRLAPRVGGGDAAARSDLLAIDGDGVLRIALIGVLRHGD